MGDEAIYVEIEIKADVDRVWRLTQDPDQHLRGGDVRPRRLGPADDTRGRNRTLPRSGGRPRRRDYPTPTETATTFETSDADSIEPTDIVDPLLSEQTVPYAEAQEILTLERKS